ncbi:MAG: hypothetical protein ACYCYK_04490 [Candidatus Dormibacteria bacterium]
MISTDLVPGSVADVSSSPNAARCLSGRYRRLLASCYRTPYFPRQDRVPQAIVDHPELS